MNVAVAALLIFLGVCVVRTFDPTFDIVGFWPRLGEIVGFLSGLAITGAGILLLGSRVISYANQK